MLNKAAAKRLFYTQSLSIVIVIASKIDANICEQCLPEPFLIPTVTRLL